MKQAGTVNSPSRPPLARSTTIPVDGAGNDKLQAGRTVKFTRGRGWRYKVVARRGDTITVEPALRADLRDNDPIWLVTT